LRSKESLREPLIKYDLDRDARMRAAQECCKGSLSSSHFLDSSPVTAGSDRMAGGGKAVQYFAGEDFTVATGELRQSWRSLPGELAAA
jgi:hypothetical protein